MRIADFDRDGNADLAIGGNDDPNKAVSIFLGDGTGMFAFKTAFRAIRQGFALAVADLNGDANPDLFVTGIGGPGGVSVHLGNGDGTFSDLVEPNSGQPFFISGEGSTSLAVVDFGSQVGLPDGSTALGPPDGHPDIIVGNIGFQSGRVPGGSTGVVILPGLFDDQGNFVSFGLPKPLASGKAPQSLAARDVNGDDLADVAVVDHDGVRVIYGERPTIPPNETPQTARDLGTVVHLVEPTLTIVPGHEEAFFKLTVPPEAAAGAGEQVIDFSALLEFEEGAGLSMEVRDADGSLLGSGDRFRVVAAEGDVLSLHVFGVAAADSTRGSGAYTLVIDVLPQIVGIESQPLLPGQGINPGGATASLVITFQGDRLDPATAEDPTNYQVTWLGPDGQVGGGDDQVIPIDCGSAGSRCVVYDPSANVEVASGRVFPTAVRQTVTLLFADPLPAGSYLVEVGPGVQTEDFNEGEDDLLAGDAGFAGHPVVSLQNGQVENGSRQQARDLVFAAGALGDFADWEDGTPFLTQLHDDLAALLDAIRTQSGDDPTITDVLLNQVLDRFDPALGGFGERPTAVLVLWLDPVSIDVVDPTGSHDTSNLDTGTVSTGIGGSYVNVGGNTTVVVIPVSSGTVSPSSATFSLKAAAVSSTYTLTVSDVPPTARGGYVVLGQDGNRLVSLTDDLRTGTKEFLIPV